MTWLNAWSADSFQMNMLRQKMWHFQTQDYYKISVWNDNALNLWNRPKPNREWGEQPCKLQMENRAIQIAKADSVIKGMCHLNITQNLSCLPWLQWYNTTLNRIYYRNSTDHLQQLEIHNKLSCQKPSHWQLYTDPYLIFSFFEWFLVYLISNLSEAEDQNVSQCRVYNFIKHCHASVVTLVCTGVFVPDRRHWCTLWNPLYLMKFGRMCLRHLSVNKVSVT